MLGITGYRIIGSKGDYIILDKRTGPLLPMPVYPVPSNTYMGIHVTNTTDGNVIIGPNADMVTDFNYYGVPQKNIDSVSYTHLDVYKRQPVPVEKQVAILYAVVKGILTSVEVEDIQAYEEGLYTFLDSDAQGVAAMEGIRTTGKLEGETEEKLKAALADYTDRFLKTR